MRIAICEDLASDAAHLCLLLTEYMEKNSFSSEIETFPNGEALLEAFSPGQYQIIFMDIYLKKGGLTGMQTAEKIHEADRDAVIILTTTSTEYGIAGYKVAAYYILKPIEEGEFIAAMEKCRTQLAQFAKTIQVIENRQLVTIRLRDIFFVESKNRACIFTTKTGVIKTNMALEALTDTLGTFPFHRCHRSFLVNLLHVIDMQEKDFLLENSQKVPISRAYLPVSRRAFQEYIRRMAQSSQV